MRKKPQISLVVTDIDNTLFDWVDVWHRSFPAMLDETIKITGLSRNTLIGEIKAVHQRHGTSEYAFLLGELPSVRRAIVGAQVAAALAPALLAFSAARDAHLKLYPEVEDTLHGLKSRGVTLIGYTESMEPYTAHRLAQLGLDGVLDAVFTPRAHDIPPDVDPDWHAQHQVFCSSLERTECRHTPAGHFKPDPSVLIGMVSDLGADPACTLYVGDSLMKDVAMAQQASVYDVHAQYGAAQDRPEYELLRAVTHWTEADVERERRLSVAGISPNFVLHRNYGELRNFFAFGGA